MDQNESRIAPSPEAASDDFASPFHPQARPEGPDPGGDLQSDAFGRYVPVATDALGRTRRHDGFTPERQCVFLDALARCGTVADACRAAGISRDTAYNLRNGAQGGGFALGWRAAILISRGRLVDELQSRVLNGVVDKIYRNGELWGERHRHDNRLAMAVLTRLDRQADGLGEGAAAARAVAQEWDQYLDIVRSGGEGASEFLAARAALAREDARFAAARAEYVAEAPLSEALQESIETLERLHFYSVYGGALEQETDLSGLDPEEMASWTVRDWARAERGGLIGSLRDDQWPEAARSAEPDNADGTCPIRQDMEAAAGGDPWERIPGIARARRLYALRAAPLRRSAVEQTTRSANRGRPARSEGGSG